MSYIVKAVGNGTGYEHTHPGINAEQATKEEAVKLAEDLAVAYPPVKFVVAQVLATASARITAVTVDN